MTENHNMVLVCDLSYKKTQIKNDKNMILSVNMDLYKIKKTLKFTCNNNHFKVFFGS